MVHNVNSTQRDRYSLCHISNTMILSPVPGMPTNLSATTSLQVCQKAIFTWNPPLENERNGKK